MREKANKEFRNYAKQKGVLYWEIADAVGISYDTFIRWLRHEFSEEELNKYKKLVDEIAKQ